MSNGCNTVILPATDGYPLTIRCWEARNATAVIILVHGVVSHSLWLAPIAEELAENGITTVCPDRRGAGASQQSRGDAPDENSLLEDLQIIIDNVKTPGIPLHLGGFCWGSNYLINFLSRHRPGITSLALLAPALFPAAGLRNARLRIDASTEPTEVPPVPVDAFTRGPAYERFILPDPLRLDRVSPRFNGIMQSFSRMIGVKLLKLPFPVLMILAEEDRITDNETTEKVFNRLQVQPRQLVYVPGEHGIQFDAPQETAGALITWLNRFNKQPLRQYCTKEPCMRPKEVPVGDAGGRAMQGAIAETQRRRKYSQGQYETKHKMKLV